MQFDAIISAPLALLCILVLLVHVSFTFHVVLPLFPLVPLHWLIMERKSSPHVLLFTFLFCEIVIVRMIAIIHATGKHCGIKFLYD